MLHEYHGPPNRSGEATQGGIVKEGAIPVSWKNNIPFVPALLCNPAAETALQPLIWCFDLCDSESGCQWLLLLIAIITNSYYHY